MKSKINKIFTKMSNETIVFLHFTQFIQTSMSIF